MNIFCGRCGPQVVRFEDFESMLALSEQAAVLTYRCPECGLSIGVASGIPHTMRRQVRRALAATGADDGRCTWPLMYVPMFAVMGAYPPDGQGIGMTRVLGPVVGGGVDARARIDVDLTLVERFREELERTDGVDDAIGFMNGRPGPVEK